jgi:3-dehydroquinate synthase
MPATPQTIHVAHGGGSSPVVIQTGLLDGIGTWLEPYLKGRPAIVVTDQNVWAALGDRFTAACHRESKALVPIVMVPGEQSKSWDGLAFLIDRLLEIGVARDDTIIALGGGVVGDIAGFASAILKRGCDLIQIPTTLLAQVDSSVGGKTGINTTAGKNLVGAFHQPAATFIDPTTLETLPERQLTAGYAEIVKYGLIDDADFFAWCEAHGPALLAGDLDARTTGIARCVRAKARIVAKDERELSGTRALLNFGHSFGHALEAQTGFSDALLHGEAVAIGMVLAFRFSIARGICPPEDGARVARHLKRCGLPTDLAALALGTDGAALAAHMRHDKKNSGGDALTLILTSGIGKAFVEDGVCADEVAEFLDDELARGDAHAALR